MRGAGVRATLAAAGVALVAAAWNAPSAAADKKASLADAPISADAPIGSGLDDASAPKLPWPEPTPETAALTLIDNVRLLRRLDGSVVLGATRWRNDQYAYWLAYLDADGRAWRQVIVPLSENEFPADAIVTRDGGFLLFSSIRELWLIRLDPDGRRLWNRKLDGYEISDSFRPKAALLPDGGFLIAGASAAESRDEVRYRLTRVTADGHVVWERSYGRRGKRTVVSLAPLNDGTALVFGSDDLFAVDRQGRTRWSRPSDAILDMSAADGQSVLVIEYARRHQEWVWGPQFHLARLDRNGRIVWRRSQDIRSSGLADSRADRLVPAPRGEFLLFLLREFTSNAAPEFGQSSSHSPHKVVLSIVRYDVNGRRVWLRTVAGPEDTNNSLYSDGLEGATVLPNGNLLVLGRGHSGGYHDVDRWWLRTISYN